MIPTDDPGGAEVKSLAVLEERQGGGIGRALIDDAAERSRARQANRLLVSTAAASSGDLRFYRRVAFRMLRVERDVFGPEQGYEGVLIDGIPLRDRVWLDRAL